MSLAAAISAWEHPDAQYGIFSASIRTKAVLTHGDPRVDRTGTGTTALFGPLPRLDPSGGRVPILTTKRVYCKTAIKEML